MRKREEEEEEEEVRGRGYKNMFDLILMSCPMLEIVTCTQNIAVSNSNRNRNNKFQINNRDGGVNQAIGAVVVVVVVVAANVECSCLYK